MILIDIYLLIWVIVILFFALAIALGLLSSPFVLIYKSFWNDDLDDKKEKRKLLFSVLFLIFTALLLTLVLSID